MILDEKEKKMSRRKRKKMAVVQRRKLYTSSRHDRYHRTAIYKHLISNTNSIKIIEHLGAGFERDLFLAALNNLSDKGNPLRFNNFAYCMREIITLILAKYSTDEDIINCHWYKNETNKENGITRAQRVKYSIHGGFSDKKVTELLELDDEDDKSFIDSKLKEFTKQFRELNEHTHLREKRFNIGDPLCEELASQVLDVINSILTLIEDLRVQVRSHLEGEIDDALISEFVSTTFNELDILSSHTTVDYSDLDSYHVDSIRSNYAVIKGYGTVYCDLQWGSGSDMRNGIGASMSDSFTYSFTIHAKLTDVKKLELGDEGITVDTDSWYE
jgi:hypothetical protein